MPQIKDTEIRAAVVKSGHCYLLGQDGEKIVVYKVDPDTFTAPNPNDISRAEVRLETENVTWEAGKIADHNDDDLVILCHQTVQGTTSIRPIFYDITNDTMSAPDVTIIACWPTIAEIEAFCLLKRTPDVYEIFSDMEHRLFVWDLRDNSIIEDGVSRMPIPRAEQDYMGHQQVDALPALERTPANIPETPYFHAETSLQTKPDQQRIRVIENPNNEISSMLLVLDPENHKIHYRSRYRDPSIGEIWGVYEADDTFGSQVVVYPSRGSNYIFFGSEDSVPILSLDPVGDEGLYELVISSTLFIDDEIYQDLWAFSYPTVGVFYQGRLWVAGHRDIPGRLWASNTLEYIAGDDGQTETITFDFTDSAVSSIDVSLPGDESIKWMHPAHDRLLVGTNRAEYVVGSSDNGPLTNLNITLQPQSYQGSETKFVANAADKVLWFDRSRVLRGTSYLRSNQAYVSDPVNMTGLFSEDFNHEVALHRQPDHDMLIITGGEVTKIGTFKEDMRRIGWGNMMIQGWTVINAASEPDDTLGFDRLYLLLVDSQNTTRLRVVEYTPDVYMDMWQEVTLDGNGDLIVPDLVHGETYIAADDENRYVGHGYTELGETRFDTQEGVRLDERKIYRAGPGFVSQLVTLPLIYAFEGGTTIDLSGSLVNANVHLIDSPAPAVLRGGELVEPDADRWEESEKHALNAQENNVERYFEVIRTRTEPLTVAALSGKLQLGSFNTVQGLTT